MLESERRGGFFSSNAQNIIRYLIDRLGLYDSFLGKILRYPLNFFGRMMMFLDNLDKSKAGGRQTMGWCIIAVK